MIISIQQYITSHVQEILDIGYKSEYRSVYLSYVLDGILFAFYHPFSMSQSLNRILYRIINDELCKYYFSRCFPNVNRYFIMYTHCKSKNIASTMRILRDRNSYLRGNALNNGYRLVEVLGNYEHGLFVATLCVPVIYRRICNTHGAMQAKLPARFLQSVLL